MRTVFRAPGVSLAAALAPATGVSREQGRDGFLSGCNDITGLV